MAIVQSGYKGRVANDDTPPNRIRELREERGLTQVDLAKLVHSTPSALNKLEKGSRGLDQQWMRRLATALSIAPADLLPREDNPNILDDDESRLIDSYRRATREQRDYFERVSDAIMPWRGQPNERAA